MFLLYLIIKTRKHSANIKKTFKFSLAAGVCWTHLSVSEAHLAHKQQSGEGNIWCLFACCEIGSQGTKPELRPQGFGIPPRRGTLPNTQERGHTSCFFLFFFLNSSCYATKAAFRCYQWAASSSTFLKVISLLQFTSTKQDPTSACFHYRHLCPCN